MWNNARNIVADVFFKDSIEIYRNEVVQNDIGEELDSPVLVSTAKCNVQYNSSNVGEKMSGVSVGQQLRISLAKSFTFNSNNTYTVKILSARIAFNSCDRWRIISDNEGQISTVIIAEREASI